MDLPRFSEAEFWNTVLWAPLGQEFFTFLRRKARSDRSVFDRVARSAAVDAARVGVAVDQVELRRLLAQERLLQALIARDLDELDLALDSVVRPSKGWTAAQARTVLVATLLLAVDAELPADRQLDLAAYRGLLSRLRDVRAGLDELGARTQAGVGLLAGLDRRVGRLAEEIGRQLRPIGYRDSYDTEISAFEDEHVPGLKDRERDLDDLTRGILQQPGYLAVEAPMYAGKTAMFAALRRRLVDRGCSVVVFYIRRNSDDTAGIFLPKIISQLLDLLEGYDARLVSEGVQATFDARRTQFAYLWQQATRLVDRPVVLLVDALDEQRHHLSQQAGGEPPISHLLPMDVGEHGRVVVSSRLNPDFARILPPEHPLARLPVDRRISLIPSPHATARREKIQRELDHQLASGNPKAEYAIGMYAIGTAPLCDDDLADLLALTPGQVRAIREPIAASLLRFHDPNGLDRFDLGHSAQREYVRRQLGSRIIAQLTDQVLAWADKYANVAPPWPDDTPVFLRDHIHTFILGTTRPDRATLLLNLVSDARRELLQRTRHSIDGFLATIDAAALALADNPPSPDQLVGFLWLLGHRMEANAAAVAIPGDVIVALARVGYATRAMGIASALPSRIARTNTLVGIAIACTEAGALQHAEQAMVQAAESAAEIDNPRERDRLLARVAEMFAQGGAIDQARQAAAEIGNPGERYKVLARIAGLFARAGSADQARQAAAKIDDPRGRDSVLATVTDMFVQAGSADQARQTAAEMDNPRKRVEMLARVAVAFAEAGSGEDAQQTAEEAWETAAEIDDPRGRAELLARVSFALARAGESKKAREVAQQARQVAETDYSPDRGKTFTSIAVAFAQVGAIERATEAAGEIREGLMRARTLAKVAGLLTRAGAADEARQVAEQARHTAVEISNRRIRAIALAQVADALVRAGEIDQAYQAAEQARQAATEVDEPRSQANVLDQIAVVFARAGAAEQAKEAAAAIRSPLQRAQILTQVAAVFARDGAAEQAQRAAERARQAAEEAQQITEEFHQLLTEESQHAAMRVDDPLGRTVSLAQVAVGLARAGAADQARQAAEQAWEIAAATGTRTWGAAVITKIAVALAQAGEIERARQTAAGIGKVRGRDWMLTEVAVAFARAGAAEQAKEAAAAIRSPQRRAQILTQVAAVFALGGSAEQAQEAARQARQTAAKIGERRQRAITLAEIAVAFAQAGADTQADQTADQAYQTAAEVGDKGKRAEALAQVAAVFACAGAIERARRIAEQAQQMTSEVDDPQRRGAVLTVVAVALAQAGEAKQAKQIATEVDDPYRRAMVLVQVAAAFGRIGEAEAARQAAGQARQTATKIGDPQRRVVALAEVAVVFARVGDGEQAYETGEQAWQSTDDVWWKREELLDQVALVFARIGAVERAWQTAAEIDVLRKQEETLAQVAVELARIGAVERAWQTAAEIDSPHRRIVALAEVAAVFARVGEVEQPHQTTEQGREMADDIRYGMSRPTTSAATTRMFASSSSEHLTGTVRILHDALSIENTNYQQTLFQRACLANAALFPAALSPLVIRFLAPGSDRGSSS